MNQLIKQFFFFGVIGGLATLVNAAIFIVLVDILHFEPLLGNFLAFLLAVMVSYFGHSWWTFKHKQHSKEKVLKFLLVALIGLGINSTFIWFLMHLLHQSAYIAALPMILITPLATFFINKFWVFKPIT